MTDTQRLLELIKAKGLKVTYVAARCGLSYPGFMNKVTNKNEFIVSEILELVSLLGLTGEDRDAIFFASDVNK